MKKTKDTIKYYLKGKMVEEMAKEFLDSIREAEDYFASLSEKMGAIRSKYELDYIIDDLKRNKVKKISVSLLQRRYKIGYVRSARYVDALEKFNIIERDPKSSLWILVK